MKYLKSFMEALSRFEGDTANHEIVVVPVDPENQSYLISFRSMRHSYWVEWFISSGWWCFNSDVGSFVCSHGGVDLMDWTAFNVIERNDHLTQYIETKHKEFCWETTREEIGRMIQNIPEWSVQLEVISEMTFEDPYHLVDACRAIDQEHGTELVMNVPILEKLDPSWAWASVCMASILMHEDVKKALVADGHRECEKKDYVAGHRELVQAVKDRSEELEKSEYQPASEAGRQAKKRSEDSEAGGVPDHR